jgi:hypothetical protein
MRIGKAVASGAALLWHGADLPRSHHACIRSAEEIRSRFKHEAVPGLNEACTFGGI